MKFCSLYIEFTFGKFSGKTIGEAIELQADCIDWYAINLDHFYIDDEVITEIKAIKTNFLLSEQGQTKLSEKHNSLQSQKQNDGNYDNYSPGYEKYGGAYGYDDVLVNYNKFGQSIKEVSGLNDKKTMEKVRGFDWINTITIR